MNCPKFGFEITESLKQSYCKNCDGCSEITKPRFELGKVDIFELARRLKEKEKAENDKKDNP